MKVDVLDLLVCPACRAHPLRYEGFAMSDEREIEHGVVWCPVCANWYPIEDGLLELLPEELAYADDRGHFWSAYATRLQALALRPYAGHPDQLSAQARQQAHSDWYASNPQQTYAAYEQTPFWQAEDALAFDDWRKEIRPGAVLLDVGCAQGRSTFKLMDLDLRVVAFDVSKALIRQAIQRARHEHYVAQITFFVGDATRFPFMSDCFDYVLVYGVLHHLPKPGEACKEIARVLSPGGKYFGSENNQTAFRAVFDLLQRLSTLWHEEAGAEPIISAESLLTWFSTTDVFHLDMKTSVFVPPHLCNLVGRRAARGLLALTDRLGRSVPWLRDQGGLLLIRGHRRASPSNGKRSW